MNEEESVCPNRLQWLYFSFRNVKLNVNIPRVRVPEVPAYVRPKLLLLRRLLVYQQSMLFR